MTSENYKMISVDLREIDKVNHLCVENGLAKT